MGPDPRKSVSWRAFARLSGRVVGTEIHKKDLSYQIIVPVRAGWVGQLPVGGSRWTCPLASFLSAVPKIKTVCTVRRLLGGRPGSGSLGSRIEVFGFRKLYPRPRPRHYRLRSVG